MTEFAYTSLKAGWHRECLDQMKAGVAVTPRQVQIILSDLCNHDCHWCAYRSSDGFSSAQFGEDTGRGFTMNPNRRIPTEKAREILNDLATLGVPAVQFTGGGEPTVHPDHIELFDLAHELGLQTALVTNGSLLRDGWDRAFPRMAWVRVSLDAGSPSTYSAVRRTSMGSFYKTLAHIESIAAAIDQQHSDCVLGVSFIVLNDNWQEIPLAADYARSAGARYIRYGACFTKKGVGYYGSERRLEQIRRSILLAQRQYQSDDFDVIDMFVTRAEDLEAQAPDFERCGYQQLNVYVAGNLKVYRCCTTSYTPHGEVGDISQRTFKDWLLDPKTTSRYANFDARTCASCPFSEKNRVVNYMLDPKPAHVDFV